MRPKRIAERYGINEDILKDESSLSNKEDLMFHLENDEAPGVFNVAYNWSRYPIYRRLFKVGSRIKRMERQKK